MGSFDDIDPPARRGAFDDIDPPSTSSSPQKTKYTLKKALAKAPHSAADSMKKFGHGVQKAVMNPIPAAESLVSLVSAIPVGAANALGGSALNTLTPPVREMVLKDHPKMKRAVEAADAVGQDHNDHYGDWDAIKRTIAEDPFRIITDAVTLASVPGVGGAAKFAGSVGMNAAKPAIAAAKVAASRIPHAAAAGKITKNISSAVARGARALAAPTHEVNNAAKFIAEKAVPKTARYIDDVKNPTNTMIRTLADGNLVKIANALSRAREIVPGSKPTATQALADRAGAPHMVAAAKAAEDLFPNEFKQIHEAQNAARVAHVRSATPHKDVDEAIKTLKVDAAKRYAKAGAELDDSFDEFKTKPEVKDVRLKGDKTLLELFARPGIQKVMDRTKEGLANKAQPFQVGKNIPKHVIQKTRKLTNRPYGPGVRAQEVYDPMRGLAPVQWWAPPRVVKEKFADYPTNALHRLKLTMDESMTNPERFGIGAVEVKDVGDLQNHLVNWITKKNKNYEEAMKAYREGSIPIDQTYLLNHYTNLLLDPVTGEDAAKLNARRLVNARKNDVHEAVKNNAIRQATGRQRVNTEGELLTKKQIENVDRTVQDLARDAKVEHQVKAGKEFSNKHKTAFSDALHVKPSNMVANIIVGKKNERVAKEFGSAVQTPEGLEKLVRATIAHDEERSRNAALYNAMVKLNNAANPFRYANKYPAIYNALQADREAKEKRKANR